MASCVESPASGGNTSQNSPALSVSSTVTEIEIAVTPLEPIAGLRVNAQASSTLAGGGNDSEREQGGEEGKTASEMGACVAAGVCSQPGAKRSWAQTSHVQQEKQQRPRNTFFTSSQFPRLVAPPTPPGPNCCRTEGSKQDLADAGMEAGRYGVHGGLFDGVAGSAEGSCGRHHQESSEESETVGNIRGGGPKHVGVESLPGQQGMDVCEMELAGDIVASTDRDASTRPGWDAPNPVVVTPPLQSHQRCSEHVPATTSVPADDDAKEAATFLAAGITGKEQFNVLCPKLRKIGWKWGGQVGMLSNNRWFMKAGAIAKTARAGVGKFETSDDVVRYVRNILRVRGATTPDGKAIEVVKQAGSESVDEHDSDSLGEGGGIKEEQGISEPMEGMPLTREEQALQTALEALHPSKAPGVMKQRATEFKRVLEFIVSSATDPSGGSLYLCGCSGTGKTQTMAHVQTEVRRVAAEVKNTPYLFPLFLLAVRYTATCKG